MNDTDVLIVGGGISGLATAWWLARSGLAVELWERESHPGGKIATDMDGGYQTERAASLLMNGRPEVNRLVRECGLTFNKVAPAPAANRYLLHAGRLHALPMRLWPMVSSPLWSWRGKLRLLVEPLVPKGGHEHETVSQFITRRLGEEVLEKAMEPYVAGTLAADPDRANACAVMPRLTALEQRYGGLALGVLMHKLLRRRTSAARESFSFRGGMVALVDALARSSGARLRCERMTTEISRVAGGWRVTATGKNGEISLRARQLVLSVPAYAAASLLTPLDSDLGALLRGVEYGSLSLVHLGFERAAIRHALDGTGFLVPRSADLALTGTLWTSTLFPDRAPVGKALLTSYLGGARAPYVADWDDERVAAAALSALDRLLGVEGEPEMVRVHRHRRALPLYYGAYPRRVAAVEQRLQGFPGLHLAANYIGGVSVRDRIISGHSVAGEVLAFMRHRPRRAGKTAEALRLDLGLEV